MQSKCTYSRESIFRLADGTFEQVCNGIFKQIFTIHWPISWSDVNKNTCVPTVMLFTLMTVQIEDDSNTAVHCIYNNTLCDWKQLSRYNNYENTVPCYSCLSTVSNILPTNVIKRKKKKKYISTFKCSGGGGGESLFRFIILRRKSILFLLFLITK